MRSPVHRSALLVWVAVVAPGLSGAHRGVVAQTSPSTPTFPSGVDVITVDAVVLDGKGRPVPGLAREDFVVTEDGRSLEVASFEAIEEQAAPIAMPADADEAAAVVTNGSPSRPGRTYAVFLDDVRIPALDRPSVREALTTFLERSVRAGDQVRLASTSGDLGWSAGIPEGRVDLLAVVSRFGGGAPGQGRVKEVFADNERAQDEREQRERVVSLGTMSEHQAQRIVEGQATGNRAIAEEIDSRRSDGMRLTHAALRRELEALSNVVGRKSLLLVSQGFGRDSRPELQAEMRETTRVAHDANVAIYFLDVRGLLTTPGYSADIGGAPDPSGVVASLVEQGVHETAGTQDLASDTGGFSVRNTNDLAPGLDRIVAESRVFYLLGIHPPPGKPPGEWRTLRVAVKRSGLTVRARRGYTVRTTDRARSLPSTHPGAAIPVRLASYVLEPVDSEKTAVAVAMEIDVGSLPSAAGPGDPRLIVRLETIARDGGGIDRRDLTLNRNATDEPNLGRAGWQSVRLDLALPPDVYRVRAEVEDSATGRRGVVEHRVAVPGQAVFRISTPVLSDTRTEAGSSAPAPVAHRSFSASGGRSLFYAFSILGAARDPSTDHPDVRIRFTVKDRSGRTLIEAPDTVVAPTPDGRLGQVIGLPLAQMPAGDYELELTVQDRVAGGVLKRKETFVVEASPSPAATADLKGRAGPAAAPVAPDLVPILERAGRYVTAYQKTFSDLVAEEDYRQDLSEPTGRFSRHSRAEMIFVSLPGPIPWAVFRDVHEVDGKKVRDREARLERLFRDSPDGAVAAASRAKAILDESARFNLGPVRRTLNVPTFALLVLHPDHQHRFSFKHARGKSIDGTQTVLVAFAERLRPTLVAGADGDVVANGSIWIDPDRGTVLRTDVGYSSGLEGRFTGAARTRIVTEYGREPRLQVTVPVQMTETYETGGGYYAGLRDEWGRLRSGFAIKAVARYSGYRRFDVTTDEKYTNPPEERR